MLRLLLVATCACAAILQPAAKSSAAVLVDEAILGSDEKACPVFVANLGVQEIVKRQSFANISEGEWQALGFKEREKVTLGYLCERLASKRGYLACRKAMFARVRELAASPGDDTTWQWEEGHAVVSLLSLLGEEYRRSVIRRKVGGRTVRLPVKLKRQWVGGKEELTYGVLTPCVADLPAGVPADGSLTVRRSNLVSLFTAFDKFVPAE